MLALSRHKWPSVCHTDREKKAGASHTAFLSNVQHGQLQRLSKAISDSWPGAVPSCVGRDNTGNCLSFFPVAMIKQPDKGNSWPGSGRCAFNPNSWEEDAVNLLAEGLQSEF